MADYRRDVRISSKIIFLDLSHRRKDWGFWDLWDLCAKHGVPLRISPEVSRQRGAYVREGRIYISKDLTLTQCLEAVPHEIVHALADEPRWEWVNKLIDGHHYDRYQFREDVAKCVGQLFAVAVARRERELQRERARRAMPKIMRSAPVRQAILSEIERLTGHSMDAADLGFILNAAIAQGAR